MAAEKMQPVATVTGLYRGTFNGLEPLTLNTPTDSSPGNPAGYHLFLRFLVFEDMPDLFSQ
jgi:hypothetical protein